MKLPFVETGTLSRRFSRLVAWYHLLLGGGILAAYGIFNCTVGLGLGRQIYEHWKAGSPGLLPRWELWELLWHVPGVGVLLLGLTFLLLGLRGLFRRAPGSSNDIPSRT
jgi:hypothetical protein